MATAPATSHYPAAPAAQGIESHTLSVIVDNEPGVLARVIGLFSGRGYNIDSLTVSETEHEKHLSRITIVTCGTPMVIEQIKNQLERLVPVHRVIDLTTAGPALQRRPRGGQVDDTMHRHQPLELVLDLLDHHRRAAGDDGDAREMLLVLGLG